MAASLPSWGKEAGRTKDRKACPNGTALLPISAVASFEQVAGTPPPKDSTPEKASPARSREARVP